MCEARGIWEVSALSSHFCYELISSLKILSFNNNNKMQNKTDHSQVA